MKTRRRILALCLTLCMLVGLSLVYALEASVSGTYGTNITWTLDTDGTLTISGKGKMGKDYFEPPWSNYSEDIKKVVISDGVTSIGNYAFSWCYNLMSITIPDGVTSISDYAFLSCVSLTSITIPDSVTNIGYLAFSSCVSLASITIPDSVTRIGDGAFDYCASLTDITIPASVTSLGEGVLRYCVNLESITVDKENPSFCAENGVLFNKDKTVLYCHPAKRDTSVYAIPDTVTTIAPHAFDDCRGIKSITIPDSVTTIGDHAFSGCDSLTSITIPASVTSIGEAAFHGCRKLSVLVDDANEHFCIVDGVIFSKDMTTLVWYLQGKTGASYVVPDGVTTIADSAFLNNHHLKSITIPDGVTSIGDGAFDACHFLESVEINGSIAGISRETFRDCQNLRSITIPDSVTDIGGYAFARCSSLTDITIPDSVTDIGYYAFAWCSSLTNITIPKSVTNIGVFAFDQCPNLKEVHFGGTRAQWNAITIETNNEALQTAAIYCSDDAPAESETIRYGNGAVAEITTAADGKMEANVTVPSGVTAEIEIPVKNVGMGTVAVIVHEDGTEEIIQNSVPGEESLTVTLSESAKFEIRDNAVTFSDVTEKNWFKKAVDFVSARGIMGGVGNNVFDHKSTTTRAMVWTMLARLRGVDTSGGATWYEKGTNWVVENNLADGLNATDVIPREELAVLLWKLCGSPDADTAILDKFSDNAKISASAREAVAWAVQTGVMGGNADGTMDPTGGATRAHVAQIIMNFMTKIRYI